MRLIDGDYLYNKLVANKCPYDLVLQMVKDEPTVDVLDKIRNEIVEEQNCWREDTDAEWYECRRILRIIDNYKAERG